MFAREGAAFIGNTGFGYGDGDLLAYSELLMLNFVKELGYNPTGNAAGNPSVGGSLQRAKLAYFNSIAAGSLSIYDEKLLGEMVLYGLPMQRVDLPNQTNVSPTGPSALGEATPDLTPGVERCRLPDDRSGSGRSRQRDDVQSGLQLQPDRPRQPWSVLRHPGHG